MNEEIKEKYLKNPRLRSLITLIIWLIFLSFLMLIVSISNNFAAKNPKTLPKTTTQEEPTYYEKLNNLLTNNYNYRYTITNNTEKTIFEGTKKNNNITGYRQDKSGIIKYRLENNIAYEILIDNEITTDKLYENIKENYLNLNYLIPEIKKVKEEDITITDTDTLSTYTYNITLNNENLNLIVTENAKYLEKITIFVNNNESYELVYQPN